MNNFSLAVLIGVSSQAFAQDFTYQAQIDSVFENEYYKINLSPELLGGTSSNTSDLRIYNGEGVEQPYLLSQEEPLSVSSTFIEYEIIDEKSIEDSISHIMFHNPSKDEINNISFFVKNTEVQKRARLSGSDDGENWFIIKNNYLLHGMYSEEETTELKMLNFPLSDYEYFRLDINDNWQMPIKILRVGYYNSKRTKGRQTSFQFPIESQIDSAKVSYVKLSMDRKKYLEKLRFDVSGAEYYLRNARVYEKIKSLDHKNKVVYHDRLVGSFELNSNSSNEIELGGKAYKELYIEIGNRDNKPLKIERITASYLKKYAIVKLEPRECYWMKWGDHNLNIPSYDIASFSDRIPKDILTINHSMPQLLKKAEIKEIQKGVFDQPITVWSIIVVVGAGLGFVTYRMIREMEVKE